jgi:hypothetical protein
VASRSSGKQHFLRAMHAASTVLVVSADVAVDVTWTSNDTGDYDTITNSTPAGNAIIGNRLDGELPLT